MPSFVRPKGSNPSRSPAVTPMSERQQLALLMQMTSPNTDAGSRSPSSARSRDRNERGETPLHLAAIKGDVEQVSRLLGHRADPNVADFAGWTPLHEACNHGWYEVAFRLVQAGASVNAKGLDNETPLHDAAINGHMKLVKLLVEKGADVHAKNAKGKTPVDVAAPAVVSLLNPSMPVNESSVSSRLQPRSRDEKKVTDASNKKQSGDETMEGPKPNEDVYEFKAAKETESPDHAKSSVDGDQENVESADQPPGSNQNQTDDNKRSFNEMNEPLEETDEENKRKKRKEDVNKDSNIKGGNQQRTAAQNKGQNSKAASGNKAGAVNVSKTADRKSPVDSPKPANASSDAELEDGKTDLKVPPLKIVIPQSTASEQESGQSRNGKSSSQRSHQALPYVVPSNSEGEKEGNSGNNSPTDAGGNKEDKKEGNVGNGGDDQRTSGHHQRVLRSSHRSGTQGSADRSSNNSSPQLQRSHSPSPSASPAATSTASATNVNNDLPVTNSGAQSGSSATSAKSSDIQQPSANSDTEPSTSSGGSSSTTAASTPAPVELHPRKRKMRPNKDASIVAQSHDPPEQPAISEVHPHEQPITNCYQLFLNIRTQIARRRKGLFPVQPKPPQGFKDYLMNRCTYVLAGTSPTSPNITYPISLQAQLKDLFGEQEKERYKLRMQHVIEKEKLVLSVEQEILRVHGRAARALANQALPFSVCTILKDEEVYNLITPEQEEKDRNARSRYNGRLFLSWLQDVDDKWEKIKEHMLLRHHNEAESLYAVQKMDWEWKMKELSLCDAKTVPKIEETHVPMVHVSDDFDLLPA
ncbi:PREDICTED: ankyrin repeat domain-containing protein 12 [Nicrophorus vespilloides]|uniref:Ankyrin repeat domain-containing protein 12 n=1 Tax=Nicrophorus vespilloides TaxID=110193 RepID=A0ABM1MKN8_NICVS|nr:PREDICTED: ankyrin repeat domain-containing protein 12 [Nicrophorus vespilloides]